MELKTAIPIVEKMSNKLNTEDQSLNVSEDVISHALLNNINLTKLSSMDRQMLKGILNEYDSLSEGTEKDIVKVEIQQIIQTLAQEHKESSGLMSKINYFKVKYASKIIH